MVPASYLLLFPFAPEVECRLCLPGWILLNSMCYFVPTETFLGYKTWAKAREFCQIYGGDLAVINSAEKEVGGSLWRTATVPTDRWMASRQTFVVSGVFKTKSGRLSLNQMHVYITPWPLTTNSCSIYYASMITEK